jgi:predicted dehydrogenase
VAEESRVPEVVTDFKALCQRDDIDVIDICTPSHLHYRMVMQALAAGKHVICEKPLVGSLKEADDLKIAEHQSGKRVMPIFQYRFGRGLQKLKLLVDEGVAGKHYLATVETAWRRRAPYYDNPWRGRWKSELGGVLVTHAIHAHDALYYILGPAKSVFARATTRVNKIEVEDCLSASLEMADGSLATSAATLGSAEEILRHRFCFSGLSAESNILPYENTREPWKFIGDTPELTVKIEATLARFKPLPEGNEGQFFRLHEALTTGKELPVTLDQARASLELISAVYFSAATNQPVALPLGKDHPTYHGWLPKG